MHQLSPSTGPCEGHNFMTILIEGDISPEMRLEVVKVALARELMDRFQLGGDIYNSLVISGRLIPTKHEAPKRGTLGDGGNPNDDSSTSNVTSSIHSQMSGTTHFPLDMAAEASSACGPK
jgi:hypothetical protein